LAAFLVAATGLVAYERQVTRPGEGFGAAGVGTLEADQQGVGAADAAGAFESGRAAGAAGALGTALRGGAALRGGPRNMQNFAPVLEDLADQIQKQQEVETEIRAELESGQYSFEEPLVVVDPYGRSPLTALVCFSEAETETVTVHVPGGSPAADVDYTLGDSSPGAAEDGLAPDADAGGDPAPGERAERLVPIVGLRAGKANEVMLTAANAIGESRTANLLIETEALPESAIARVQSVRVPSPENCAPGMTFLNILDSRYAFDVNGDCRWFTSKPLNDLIAEYQFGANGDYLVTRGNTNMGDTAFVRQNLLGRVNALYGAPYGNHHDIEPTARGTFLVTGAKAPVGGAFLYEIDEESGQTVNELPLYMVFQESRDVPEASRPEGSKDWFHLNSIDDLGDGTLLVSGRNQSTVARIAWPSGELRWMLAAPEGWDEEHLPYLLAPVDEDFVYPNMQHAPVALPDQDGNPDTLDILLFDNGTQRALDIPPGAADAPGSLPAAPLDPGDAPGSLPDASTAAPPDIPAAAQDIPSDAQDAVDAASRCSRIVQLRVDEEALTVSAVWEYTGLPDDGLFSQLRGNAQRLENGNTLGTYPMRSGQEENEPVTIREVTPAGEVVWEIVLKAPETLGGLRLTVCQSMRLPLYTAGMEDIRLGEPPRDLIPEEVYRDYGMSKGNSAREAGPVGGTLE
jgi:hypothetical protein